MTETATTEFYVFEPNLVWTLLILSQIVNYDINSDDVDAVDYGLTSTSFEKDIWWTYKIIGDKTIDLRFARDDEDTDIICIQLSFDKELFSQIQLCIFVVQEFYLHHRNLNQDLKANLS